VAQPAQSMLISRCLPCSRDWVSDFNRVEENSGNMAESGMKFIKSQSKKLAWKKLYNIHVVQVP